MLGRIKLPLAAAVIGLTLVVSIAVASADLFVTAEPAGSITDTSLGALTFRTPLQTVTCNLSLTGSLQSASSIEGYGGSISRASVSSCTGATVTTSTETPWSIVYDGTTGTLPNLTELRIGLYNVDLLFDVSFFGIPVRCELLGHFDALSALTREGSSFRTGLATIQTTGQRWAVYRELDTSGLCPKGEEVSASGSLQILPNVIFPYGMEINPISPARPIAYSGSETKTITFRNEMLESLTVGSVRTHFNSRYAVQSGTSCLTQPGETQKAVASAATCTVDVTFTNPPNGRIAWFDTVELRSPGGTLLGSAFLRFVP